MSTRRERRKEKAISRHSSKPTTTSTSGTSEASPDVGEKITPAEVRQEKSFFIWTGAITLAVMLLLYFVMMR